MLSIVPLPAYVSPVKYMTNKKNDTYSGRGEEFLHMVGAESS